MASILLFHSVLGLRPVELAAAEMIRRAGHSALTPDLYDGATADTVEGGMALKDAIGWERICERTMMAVDTLPPATVLAGFSMGCGVVASVWPERPETRGILLLHALADIPDVPVNNLRAQLHLGERDGFWSADDRMTWQSERHGTAWRRKYSSTRAQGISTPIQARPIIRLWRRAKPGNGCCGSWTETQPNGRHEGRNGSTRS
ncbi:dienelactone hydrolase family protein [Mesorhizobium sp. Cs1299R1N3]|uniref:dienelactone hydrolase family protein n=1 Tax=Mesorhizobium sp. Cs1299R1N3 TaxID=3015173 RepID=UPI00301DE796